MDVSRVKQVQRLVIDENKVRVSEGYDNFRLQLIDGFYLSSGMVREFIDGLEAWK